MGAVWISRTKQWFWARMARAMHLEYKLPSVPHVEKEVEFHPTLRETNRNK